VYISWCVHLCWSTHTRCSSPSPCTLLYCHCCTWSIIERSIKDARIAELEADHRKLQQEQRRLNAEQLRLITATRNIQAEKAQLEAALEVCTCPHKRRRDDVAMTTEQVQDINTSIVINNGEGAAGSDMVVDEIGSGLDDEEKEKEEGDLECYEDR
jgi:hypothetical protein